MKLEELKKEAVEELEKIFHEVPPCSLLFPETKETLLTYIDKASKCIELPEKQDDENQHNTRGCSSCGWNSCIEQTKKLNNLK